MAPGKSNFVVARAETAAGRPWVHARAVARGTRSTIQRAAHCDSFRPVMLNLPLRRCGRRSGTVVDSTRSRFYKRKREGNQLTHAEERCPAFSRPLGWTDAGPTTTLATGGERPTERIAS